MEVFNIRVTIPIAHPLAEPLARKVAVTCFAYAFTLHLQDGCQRELTFPEVGGCDYRLPADRLLSRLS